LWLWHNYLDESHQISQTIETSAGSAWHGLMHRREGDFWNSNYWFARARDASLFEEAATEFDLLGFERAKLPARFAKLLEGTWLPAEFTNEVERVLQEKRQDEIEAALQLATAEWRALFRACWNAAVP